MEFLESDLNELYETVKAQAAEEGAYTLEAWKSIVEAVLQDRAEFGEIHDEDMEEIREGLVGRFADFEAELPNK
jgi:hypothetical protein